LQEWQKSRDLELDYANGDNWDKMYQNALQLLGLFARQERIKVRRPHVQLQLNYTHRLSPTSKFVAWIDAIGELDGRPCLLEWKTSRARYPEQPAGLYSLDPQLVAYSWITGIADLALVVFVRKRQPEIQYLPVTIAEPQRREYSLLVRHTIGQIERAQFLAHAGVRFPQNGCVACSYQGLCLNNRALAASKLERRPGRDALDWVDEIVA
jgi:hypothetical protein